MPYIKELGGLAYQLSLDHKECENSNLLQVEINTQVNCKYRDNVSRMTELDNLLNIEWNAEAVC